MRTNVLGETALHIAASTQASAGSLQVIQLLLENIQTNKSLNQAAYVNARNALGETSLHVVSSQLNATEIGGRTSGRLRSTPATYKMDREIVQTLLQAGGDVSLGTYEVCQSTFICNFKRTKGNENKK